MPELKRTFSGGVMNKDLDERLVPEGQYRDALNVQVSTAEGSDVGSLHNILGNNVPYSPVLNDASRLGTNAMCIGSIRKDDTECIYWFVESTTKSCIVEYNQSSGLSTPVLVDSKRILNFSRDNLITGVEILDDFLIWTDNASEPKMINISDWKEYTNDSWSHTQIDGGNFEEKHCTVIKEAPKLPPTLIMSNTTRSGAVSATLNASSVEILGFDISIGYSFTYINSEGRWQPISTGDYTDQNGDGNVDSQLPGQINDPAQSQIIVSGTTPDFKEGDKLEVSLINNNGEEAENDGKVILSIIETYASNPKLFKVNIDSVSEYIEEGIQSWQVKLIQKPALFEDKFVRFSYRYKYADGQYSTIAPFSERAFIGDTFDYDHSKGYNLGMVNQLRKLEINNWAYNVPYSVEEIDVLYKDSVSNNIYVVQTIKSTDDEFANDGSLEITSESIYKLIPSNQLLRPYDNVPRKAKALSVSGNRLLFGNYLENYDLKKDGTIVTPTFSVSVKSEDATVRQPVVSVKSQRTYQVGVVYVDKYGRETPVLTHSSGSVKLSKGFAKNKNLIAVKVNGQAPDWAVGYKHFIKETSQPYYNLAMDRFYKAEDGNVWVSFASSDRNKIQEDTYLIIKKKHASDAFVADKARYKVLSIENEAPDFIKYENLSKGTLSASLLGRSTESIFGTTDGYPLSANKFVDIKADDWKKVFGGEGSEIASSIPVHKLNNLSLQISNSGNSTRIYEIHNIQYLSHLQPDVYRLNITEPFSIQDVQFMKTIVDENSGPTLSIEIFQKENKIRPEYQGRFFAKLRRDLVLEESIIIENTADATLKVKASQPTFAMGDGTYKDAYWYGALASIDSPFVGSGWFWCKHLYYKTLRSFGPLTGNTSLFPGGKKPSNVKGWGAEVGNNYMELAFHGFGGHVKSISDAEKEFDKFANPNIKGTQYFPQQHNLVEALSKVGTRFRFADDPNKEENIYTIKNYAKSYIIAHEAVNSVTGNVQTTLWKQGREPWSRVVKFSLILDKKIKWAPEDLGFTYAAGASSIPRTNIEIIESFYDEDRGEFTDNPAIFETEPKEAAELDIYHEVGRTYDVSTEHGITNDIDYSNCYSFGNGVESDRIRDDFNAPIIGKGVKASSVTEEQYKEVRKKSDIIYSGIYNSTSSVNRLNQFIQAERITKSINPAYGSIQLMQFRLGNLDVYLEDNVVKIFSDKDALFNADGSANVVSSSKVLGAVQPYAGDFGISKNPESYSRYGNRAYFSDKNRGVVLRLSGNGLEPISRYGLEDYFADKLAEAEQVIGSYDEHKKEYNLTFKKASNAAGYNETVSFKEQLNGWTSRKSFVQENGLSLNNIYYTFGNGDLWSHNNETRNNFYGTQYNSSVKFIFNTEPGSVKSFKTLNYEGSQARVFVDDPDTDNKFSNRAAVSGWWVNSIESDLQSGQVKTFKNKEGKWFYNISGTTTTSSNLDTKEYSVQGLGLVLAASDAGGTEIKLRVE